MVQHVKCGGVAKRKRGKQTNHFLRKRKTKRNKRSFSFSISSYYIGMPVCHLFSLPSQTSRSHISSIHFDASAIIDRRIEHFTLQPSRSDRERISIAFHKRISMNGRTRANCSNTVQPFRLYSQSSDGNRTKSVEQWWQSNDHFNYYDSNSNAYTKFN